MPPKVGQGLWKAQQMPPPKNYGPRIRPVENWSVKFNPKDPSTWRSGAGKAAMNAVEANNVEELKAVIAATPFVKHVLDFTEQLDAAARKKASKTAAVLLPWCDMDAWRQCLLISAQLQDCATLHLLLCDIDDWHVHDAFRRQITEDEFHPLAHSSLTTGAKVYAKATPFRERGREHSLFDRSDFVTKGPWQRRRLLDVLPACSGGRHLILQRCAEAACRDTNLPLLHAVIVISMEPTKAAPFAAAGWQPRCNNWISSILERSRSAAGVTIIQAEAKISKLKHFEEESSGDYLSVVNDVGGVKEEQEAAERMQKMTDLQTLLEQKRALLDALDYYLAVAHGGAAAHPTRHSRITSSAQIEHAGSSQDSLTDIENSFQADSLDGSHIGGGSGSVHPINHDFKHAASAPVNSHGLIGGNHHPSVSSNQHHGGHSAVAEATLEVIRFDRRVPMRDRWRQAGDNPAWRGFVPQWTSELGAHRVWRNKMGQRSRMLNEFNTIVAGGSEKPAKLEAFET